jgi:DNA end-binding protein Ku
MVSIPIGVYPAIGEKDVAFHQIHAESGTRITYQKYCEECKRAVKPEEIQRGYEYSKGQYVVVTDEELNKLPVPAKQIIEILAFVDADEIDPIYYDRSYYIEPEKVGRKPYALLLKAVGEKRVVALAKVALRNKEHLCVLRGSGRHLVMETLFYPDEVRDATELNESDMKISDRELKMAESLVDMLKDKFEPERYHDTYREKLLELIEAKAEGKELKTVKEPEHEAKVIDLMEALKASVEAAKKRKTG